MLYVNHINTCVLSVNLVCAILVFEYHAYNYIILP